jgi:DNA replication protein DnaC
LNSYENQLKEQCDISNSLAGTLSGYDCPECKNRGYFYKVIDNSMVAFECRCKEIRRNMQRIIKSGLQDKINKCTFENYITADAWQKKIKDIALDFVAEVSGNWFYIGGQSGAGKTHLCTAIASELMKKGKSLKYMIWMDESKKLKSNINDDFIYSQKINELKSVDVLYIDDFFKTATSSSPTASDISIAFEIINYRYNNPNSITIISSEKSILDIIDLDEALAGRIKERTEEYFLNIFYDTTKNYRLRDFIENGGEHK